MNTKQLPTMVDESKAVAAPLAQLTPMEMLNTAINRGADMDVLTKLMDLQERWERTQARKAFDDAIAAAKAEIKPIPKNRLGHGDRKYADMAAIAEAVDPIITSHGLSYRYRTVQTDRITVTCVLSHRAGHYEETTLSGPADQSGAKNAIQAIGSTLTYLQRYSIMQALGLAVTDDDDGEASAKRVANGDFSGDYDDGVPNKLLKPPEPKKYSGMRGPDNATRRWDEKVAAWKAQMDECQTVAQLEAWGSDHHVVVLNAPSVHKMNIYRYFETTKDNLREAELSDVVVHDSDDENPRPATADDFDERESVSNIPPATSEPPVSPPHQPVAARVPPEERAAQAFPARVPYQQKVRP